MQFIIKCGGEGCAREFKADTEERTWTCTNCGHEIENRDYPFLSARLMEAKRLPEEADWRDLLDLILRKARVKMMENNLRLMEEGMEKTSMADLVAFEGLLDRQDVDFKEKTLEALKVLGDVIRAQEDRLTGK